MEENILVRCMNSFEIADFLMNIVCRDRYKIKRVLKTESVNRYLVEVVVKDSIFPKRRIIKTCEFLAYDDYFVFEDTNKNGEFNNWWLCFWLVRCTKYLKDYLPSGEDEEVYSYKVHQFLKSRKLLLITGWKFHKVEHVKSKSGLYDDKLNFIEIENPVHAMESGDEIIVSGDIFGKNNVREIRSISKNVKSIDFPLVIDEEENKFILAGESGIKISIG